jgi:hypothetical protein
MCASTIIRAMSLTGVQTPRVPRSAYPAWTATDMMTTNPISIPETALVGEATVLLTDCASGGVPSCRARRVP